MAEKRKKRMKRKPFFTGKNDCNTGQGAGQPLFEKNVRFFPPCAACPDVVSCGQAKRAIPAFILPWKGDHHAHHGHRLRRRPHRHRHLRPHRPAGRLHHRHQRLPPGPGDGTDRTSGKGAQGGTAGAGASHQHGRHPRAPLGKGPGHAAAAEGDHRPAGGPVGRAAHHHRRSPDPDEQRQERQEAEKGGGRCGGIADSRGRR